MRDSFLKKLQAKPDSAKKQIMLLTSLTITLIIFIIWLIIIGNSDPVINGEINAPGPLSIISKQLSSVWSDISKGFSIIVNFFGNN